MSITADELKSRIECMYAAVGSTVELDISKITPNISRQPTKKGFVVNVNWDGGMSEAEILNLASNAIHMTSIFYDHCLQWAQNNGIPAQEVNAVTDNSKSWLIIRDLDNKEKHPHRAPNRSGVSPILRNVRRVAETKDGGAIAISLTFAPDTRADLSGKGNARIVIFGEIRNSKTGDLVGLFQNVLEDAIRAWETFLQKQGLLSS